MLVHKPSPKTKYGRAATLATKRESKHISSKGAHESCHTKGNVFHGAMLASFSRRNGHPRICRKNAVIVKIEIAVGSIKLTLGVCNSFPACSTEITSSPKHTKQQHRPEATYKYRVPRPALRSRGCCTWHSQNGTATSTRLRRYRIPACRRLGTGAARTPLRSMCSIFG